MDPLYVGFFGILILIFLIIIRIPIAVAMGGVGLVGSTLLIGAGPVGGIAQTIPYELVKDWNLTAVPMFLLMGYVASAAGLTDGLFKAARVFLGRVPGGLASATVVASGLFAAASGSSVATAAAFSRIAVPEMLKAGYDPSLATGSVASAGTLGSLIPPSVLLIIYGLVMNISIGTLFIAAVIPGIISAVLYIIMIMTRCKINPALAPLIREQHSTTEKTALIKEVWPLPVLIVGVLGGIFAGIFTATEAGAVGSFLAFVLALVRRKLTFEVVRKSLFDTGVTTAAIFIIVVGAGIFSRFVALSTLPMWITSMFGGFGPLWIVVFVTLLYLVLGCFMESISIMLLTLPVLVPLLNGASINLIWFGVLITKLLEIGLITPPFGLNVYVIRSSLGEMVKLGTIFRGVLWFIATDFVTVTLLIAFPALMLWLPSMMR